MKTKVKKNKKQNVILTVLFCMFVFYLVAATINLQTRIAAKENSLENLNNAYQQQIDENAELQMLIENSDESVYLEKIARDQYNYVNPDERVYRENSYGW